jgi:phosphatidylglycerol:prolipoprotein diacylglycerol transferase
MAPVLEIGGLSISSYLTFVTLALLLGVSTATALAPRLRISRSGVIGMAVVAIVCGFVGARLPGALLEPGLRSWLAEPGSRTGSLSIQPALLFAASGLAFAARSYRVSVLSALDLAAPATAAGIAVGRIGCLMAGCCYGKPTLGPIALVYSDFSAPVRPIGVPLHATQLYAAAACGLIALYLIRHRLPRQRFPGQLFLDFLILYSVQRFAIEFLRGDSSDLLILGLSVPQVLCLAALALAVPLYQRLPGRSLRSTTIPPFRAPAPGLKTSQGRNPQLRQ